MPQHDQIEIFETVERDFSRFPCLGPSKDRQFIMMYISGNPVCSYKATKVSSVASANTMPSSQEPLSISFQLLSWCADKVAQPVRHIQIGSKPLIRKSNCSGRSQSKKSNDASIESD